MVMQEHVRNESGDVPNAEVHLRGSGGQLRSEDLFAARESAAREGARSRLSLNSIPFHYANAPADADDNSFFESTGYSLTLHGEVHAFGVGDSSVEEGCFFLILIEFAHILHAPHRHSTHKTPAP